MSGPNSALKEAPPTPDTEWLNPGHPCRGVNRPAGDGTGRVELLMPDGVTPRRKFALVGFSTATRHFAPLNDPEWAVVGMNQLARHLRHPVPDGEGGLLRDDAGNPVTELRHGDLWFEIHRKWNEAVVPGTDHAGWLRDCDMPVYMTEEVEGVPTAVRFPVERLIAKFSLDYFTSTVAYMLAWAIDHIDNLVAQRVAELPRNGESAGDILALIHSLYEEYTIGVFGIDLIVGTEYFEQKCCAEFWLGQALARNISVIIPQKSALLKQHYRYGYDVETQGFIRESDLMKRRAGLLAQHKQTHEHAIEIYGRLAELDEWPADDKQLAERRGALTKKHQEVSQDAVTLHGALTELNYWAEFRKLRERGGALE